MGGVTYLVGSYREEAQVLRLARRLRADSPGCRIAVLRDAKAPPLSRAVDAVAEVIWTPTPVTWGDASLLTGLLVALGRLALAPDDWLVTISEQSYPVRPIAEFEEHLRAARGDGVDTFMDEFIDADPAAVALLARLRTRPVALPMTDRPAVRRTLNRVSRRLGRSGQGREGIPVTLRLPRLRAPFGPELVPHAGSDWFVLTGRAVALLLDPANDPLLHYFRHTVMPSESYLHTVLLNRPDVANVRQPLHYLRFDGAPHAHTLGLEDLPAAYASGAWFARKFEDGPVLDELDRHLAG